MTRRLRLGAALLAVVITGCAAASNVETEAARLPKVGTPIDPGTPPAAFTPLPTFTVGPPGSADQLIPRSFPPPFSYGPRYAPPTAIPTPVEPQRFPPDAVNVLLLGSDRRSGRSFRTDTILVLSIHPSARGAALLSIPRDLYVYLPGFNMRRVNAALTLGEEYRYPGGGRAMLADTLLYNFGIPIHYYAQVEMDGFRQIVDRLGGIEVHVACEYEDWRLKSPDLNPNVEENWQLFTVPAGVVVMDGDYALWYARARSRSSDFDRARRQQEVLRAIHRQVLRLELISEIPDLYSELVQSVQTDMSLADIMALAPMATRIDASRVRSRFIGRDQVQSWRTPTGGQVLLPEADAINHLLDDTFQFEDVNTVVPEPALVVEIVNASDHPDWGTLASERLTYAGYRSRLLRSGVEPHARSRLIDYGLESPADRNQLLSALGLGASAVENEPANDDAAFRFLIGNDFKPCFDPTRFG